MNHDSAYSSFNALAEKEIRRIAQAGNLSENAALTHDLRIVCQLVDSEKYTLNDIANALVKGTLRQRITTDSETLLLHVSRVLKEVNRVRFTATSGAYKLAQRSYLKSVAAMMNQYRDYSKDSYGIYHDGSIALDLLMKEGYTLEVVDTVLRKNSFCQMRDDIYFKELTDALRASKERYDAIRAVDVDADYTDAVDMYRKYAKRYMERTGVKRLAAKDEQRIVRSIYVKLLRSYEGDMPKNIGKAEIIRFNEDLAEVILPAIREALEKGSPVVTEPGRDTFQYIESVLMGIQGFQSRAKSFDEEVAEAEKKFDSRMEELLRKRMEMLHSEKQGILDDCCVAKEMLDLHQNPIIVARSIASRSQVAAGPENPKPSANSYGEWVVACAKNSLHADRRILYCKDECPEESSYELLKAQGFSAGRLYILALAERVRVYPSFAARMSEKEADIDACEKLMTRYRDIDTADLKDALREFSPRGKLAGIGENYEDRVMEAVARRLHETSRRESSNMQLQQEFNRLRGLASEGILSDNPMNAYKDGKVAVTMLQRNENPDDIMELVRNMAVAASIAVPELYAANIIEAAKEVVARCKAIENFEMPEGTDEENIANAYMEILKKRYHPGDFPTAEMDVLAVKELILSGKYRKSDIQDAVEACSPNAAEPGRDRHYKEFAYESAKTAIDTEYAKLKAYKAILRPGATELEEEIIFQRAAVREAVTLPPVPEMDVPIAIALLSSGRYQEADIFQALAKETGEEHAASTMRMAKDISERHEKISREPSHERVLRMERHETPDNEEDDE